MKFDFKKKSEPVFVFPVEISSKPVYPYDPQKIALVALDAGYSITDSVVYVENFADAKSFLDANQQIIYDMLVGDETDITAVDGSQFYQCGNLYRVRLSTNIIQIGTGAFQRCPRLREITGAEVANVASYAFQHCTNLVRVDFPHMANIGENAFGHCYLLSDIKISDRVQYIQYSTFEHCRSLERVGGQNVVGIETRGFYGCTGLKSINFPQLQGTNSSVFVDCHMLDDVKMWAWNVVTANTFQNCYRLKNIAFSDNLTAILGGGFVGCSSLQKVEIPSTIAHIETTAFRDCPALLDIVINKPENSIPGAPWGATNANVIWTG